MRQRPECVVRAWSLAEEDVLAPGVRVVSVQRESAAGRVVVGSGDGGQRILYREDRLVVAHRVAIDGTTGSARHVGWLVSGLRRARRVWWREVG